MNHLCQNDAICVDNIAEFTYTCLCLPGYAGTYCQDEIDECVIFEVQCQNGGTCIDSINEFRCLCLPGYHGEFCEIEIDECSSDPCVNGGTCIDGVGRYSCTCLLGYTGENCEIILQNCGQMPCLNGATCQDTPPSSGGVEFLCLCTSGFVGEYCETELNECLSSPCANGGTCVDMENQYECICPSGWEGTNCRIESDECASGPCLNGGSCTDAFNSFTCECSVGFEGALCEINIDECASNPCNENAGLCQDLVDGYQCYCLDGFTGDTCEININECLYEFCQNGATCVDGVASVTCICATGFTGQYCDVEINECLPDPCMNSASCVDLIGDYQCACKAGFTGKDCELNIDECASNPCQRNGSCIDAVDTYICQCQPPYRGENCELLPCQDFPCENGGTCVDLPQSELGFQCTCLPGFTGTSCEINIDECRLTTQPACLGNGLCVDGDNTFTCLCQPGWAGEDCGRPVDDCINNQCQNGATCVDLHLAYHCDCPDGWSGDFCEIERDECLSLPCQNGATCIDLFQDYRCICLPGWNSKNCDEDIKECQSNPCRNGGTCMEGTNEYSCQCPAFFTGKDCETSFDPCEPEYNECLNGARCMTQSDGSYSCECLPGFSGFDCEININECSSSPCQNGGLCRDLVNGYICVCIIGFEGVNCEVNTNDCLPGICRNGATCVDLINDYECQCASGWNGKNCTDNVDECSSQPCQNGATCQDLIGQFQCQCTPGFAGTRCELDIDECSSQPCQNGAVCNNLIGNYSCQCPAGWTGRDCDEDIDDCVPFPCNNGICEDLLNGYQCQCNPGWQGDNCDININECDSDPCQNDGTCIDLDNQYSCFCTSGYTGVNCEFDINVCIDPTSGFTQCLNGATCIDGPGLEITCSCVAGYTDPFCGTDINECASDPCQNGAQCIDLVDGYICNCTQGWAGDLCTEDVDECESSPCVNGALCRQKSPGEGYVCYCVPGYGGINCEFEINECLSNPCRNGGTCDNEFNRYRCICRPGYTGVNCEMAVDQCSSQPCLNGATCVQPQLSSYFCVCPVGYVGVNCEYQDLCTSVPCLNGATCISNGTTYSCVCPVLYSGKRCEIPLIQPTSSVTAIQPTSLLSRSQITSTFTTPMLSSVGIASSIQPTRTISVTSKVTSIETLPSSSQVMVTPTPTPTATPGPPTCEDRLCLNGATCVDFVEDGEPSFNCTCTFQYQGVYCESAMNIQTPAFTGDSYLEYSPLPLSTQTSTVIRVEFQTTAREGSLIYSAGEYTNDNLDAPTNFIHLYVQDGVLKYQFSCRISTFILDTQVVVNTGEQIEAIIIQDRGCQARVIVESTVKEDGLPCSFSVCEMNDLGQLYVGGLPANMAALNSASALTGFVGCVRVINIDGTSLTFMDALSGDNVYECASLPTVPPLTTTPRPTTTQPSSTTPATTAPPTCADVTCENGGTCTDVVFSNGTITFQCSCLFGYQGTYCEQVIEPISTASATLSSTPTPAFTRTETLPSSSQVIVTPTPTPTATPGPPTCEDGLCLNGATCVDFVEDGEPSFNCTCTFQYQGVYCESAKNIQTPAFTGDSYLEYSPLPLSTQTSTVIRVEFQTTAREGSLIYSAGEYTNDNLNEPTNFIHLYVEDGVLKYQFSCTIATFILDTEVVVNTGQQVEAIVVQDQGCQARVIVESTVKEDGLLCSFSVCEMNDLGQLYVGGLPANMAALNSASALTGFVGCVRVINIDGTSLTFMDALSGDNVYECASLPTVPPLTTTPRPTTTLPPSTTPATTAPPTCADVTCENGGTCTDVVFSNGTITFQCSCPFGYQGTFCQEVTEPISTTSTTLSPTPTPAFTSTETLPSSSQVMVTPTPSPTATPGPPTCEDGLCLNGATCVDFVEDGEPSFNCTCTFQYQGVYCESGKNIQTPAFTGDSYLEYSPLPLSTQTSTVIRVEFQTTAREGSLIYSAGEYTNDNLDESTNFIHLYVEDGVLKYQFSCKISTFILDTEVVVNTGQEFEAIVIQDQGCQASVIVGSTLKQDGLPCSFSVCEMNDLGQLYVGGLPANMASLNSASALTGFVGCVRLINIDGTSLTFMDALSGDNVYECASLPTVPPPTTTPRPTTRLPSSTTPATTRPPTCADVTCENGGTCTDVVFSNGTITFQCSCPFGYQGTFCQEVIEPISTTSATLSPTPTPAFTSIETLPSSSQVMVTPTPTPTATPGPPTCEDGLCLNGATCVDFVEDGEPSFNCTCTFQYQGVYCESAKNIQTPAFTGDSYLEYSPLPLSTQTSTVIRVEFQTTATEGSLIYSAGAYTNDMLDAPTNFIHLYIEGGILKYQFSCKISTFILDTEIVVNTGQQVEAMVVQDRGCQASVIVERTVKQDGLPCSFSVCEMNDLGQLYVGGLPANMAALNSASALTGFVGCVRVINIDGTSLTFMDALSGDNVYECASLPTVPPPTTTPRPPTTLPPPTTAAPIAPPTCVDVLCENGGTCTNVELSDGTIKFQCSCPLHFKGTFCQEDVAIHFPAFNGNSYLEHSGLEFSSELTNEIYVTFKTVATEGTIIYSAQSPANPTSNFIHLYIFNGVLNYQLNCGIGQIMTVNTLAFVSNDELIEVFIRQTKPSGMFGGICTASVTVNNNLPVTASVFTFMSESGLGPLYLGGIPPTVVALATRQPVVGFVGCIRHLQINDIEFFVFDDAIDGVNIGECEVEACTYEPCRNNATCTVSPENPEEWFCECQPGYEGELCERTTEHCIGDPCLHGGTCISVVQGFVCLCPYGRHGIICDLRLNVTRPHFSGLQFGYSSFLAYQRDLNLDFLTHMKLKFTLDDTTMSLRSGLMVYSGQRGEGPGFGSDYVALGVQNGYLVWIVDLGSGPAYVWSRTRIDTRLTTHAVEMGHDKQVAWLKLDDQVNVTGRTQGRLVGLNSFSDIFVGGFDVYQLSLLPNNVNFTNGFQGCIFDVEIKAGKFSEFAAPGQPPGQVKSGRNVGQCGLSECELVTCSNGGTCIDLGASFECLCTTGWTGELCDEVIGPCDASHDPPPLCAAGSTCSLAVEGYVCHCPLGKMGQYCDQDFIVSDPLFQTESSYIALPAIDIRHNTNITIQFKPDSEDGLLFYAAQHLGVNSGDFLAVSLYNGFVEFRYKLGPEDPVLVRTSNKVDVASEQWNTVEVGRTDRSGYVILNDVETKGTLTSGLRSLDVTTLFYLGGVSHYEKLPANAMTDNPSSYKGCVRQLIINNRDYELNLQGAVEGQDVLDCDGTACGYNVCKNNGACAPVGTMDFVCSCFWPLTGKTCEESVFCVNNLCQNGATCVGDESTFRYSCVCPVGYGGFYCNQEITFESAQFNGNSYLLFELEDYNQMDLTSSTVSLNFSTTSTDGLILWMGQPNRDDNTDYLGVGLVNGRVKLSLSLGWQSYGSIFSSVPVTDGQWHSLIVDRAETAMSLYIDGIRTPTYTIGGSYYELNTDGLYYLGGFGYNADVSELTMQQFSSPFLGCIRDVQVHPNMAALNLVQAQQSAGVQSCDSDVTGR
ncbi:protein eyes shut homolog [Ptychodera flava]|uniref:protein eyes shut homolog n=1 Tax=Ptychodera flava TaxID=63121 RepID=UPI00396A5074